MSKGKPLGHCKTCHSEIIATVNDGVFRGGECDACEYHRHASQPELLAALDVLLSQTVDMDLAYGIGLTEGETKARGVALNAIAMACGESTVSRSPGSS